MNEYLQNCSAIMASALCIRAAKKELNSDSSCSNSGSNGVCIRNSICLFKVEICMSVHVAIIALFRLISILRHYQK